MQRSKWKTKGLKYKPTSEKAEPTAVNKNYEAPPLRGRAFSGHLKTKNKPKVHKTIIFANYELHVVTLLAIQNKKRCTAPCSWTV